MLSAARPLAAFRCLKRCARRINRGKFQEYGREFHGVGLRSSGIAMRPTFRKILTAAVLAASALSALPSVAEVMPDGYITYDPAKEGMRDLSELLPIEGCNAPGGLTRTTDTDEPGSAAFWCGQPPECLAEGTPVAKRCKYVRYCRREPRGDPNGAPGANGCRNPEDLRCPSGGMPNNGRCN